jgi:GntR family transcriptional regulator
MPRTAEFRLETTSDRPLYLQLVDWLREDVASKSPGDRIDSEPKLAVRFGVSRFTVTRAIEIMVDEGLVSRRQGLGSFVAAPPLKRAPSYLLSFSEAVSAQGRNATHRLLAFGPAAWREPLPYEPGTALLALDRLRLVDRIPTAIHRSIISAELADRVGLTRKMASLPRFSLYRLFDEAGLIIKRGVETLRARGATSAEAGLLRLGDDRVVMAVQRQTFADDGAVLDVVDAVYDARRYTYQAEIRREVAPVFTRFQPTKPMEYGDASNSIVKHPFGPRLGPWSDRDGDRGRKAGRADYRAGRPRRSVL